MQRRYFARLISLTLAVPGLLFPISFNTPRAFPTGVGNAGYSMASGDFNADGFLDLAIAIVGTDQFGDNFGLVEIFLGQGGGNFGPGQTYKLSGPPIVTSNGMIVADFNGDGKLDLALVQVGGVSVLLGNGDGTFGPTANLNIGTEPFAIASADFNGDGIPDLATANVDANNISILLGKGDGPSAARQLLSWHRARISRRRRLQWRWQTRPGGD